MPGPYIRARDHTADLVAKGYWASYNRIADPFLFELTNQTAWVEAYGPHYTYNETARAVIFARLQGGVVDGKSLRRVLRYNQFQTDPISTQGCTGGWRSASNAISERGDLTSPNAQCLPDIVNQSQGWPSA